MRDRRLLILVITSCAIAVASYVLLVRPLSRDDHASTAGTDEASGAVHGGAAPALAAAHAGGKPPLDCAHPQGDAATVNGTSITTEELCSWLVRLGAVGTEGVDRKQARQLLDRLIDAALVDRALATAGLEVSKEEVAARLHALGISSGSGSGSGSASAPELLREQVRQQLELRALAAASADLRVEETEVERELAAGAPGIDRGQGVRVEGWLARVAPKADSATRARAERAAQDFASAVGGAAPDAAAAKYGLAHLPPFLLSQSGLEPALEAAAFALGRGEYSKPIDTRAGWTVLRVLDRVEGSKLDDKALRARVRSALETRRLQAATKQVLDHLRARASIEILLDL